MKTVLFVLFLALTSTYANQAADPAPNGQDIGTQVCQVNLVKHFRSFEVKHSLDGKTVGNTNIIEFAAEVIAKKMDGCADAFSTNLYTVYGGNRVAIGDSSHYSKIKDDAISKHYSYKVADLKTVANNTKVVRGNETYRLVYILAYQNAKKQTIGEYEFKQYVTVDDDTRAVALDESRADTDIVKTHIVWDHEDCANDGADIEGCVAKINLTTVLKCYTDDQYSIPTPVEPVKLEDRVTIGDTLYCELRFLDPTIKKYLHIATVHVVTTDKDGKDVYKNIVPTGWYTAGKKTVDYTRFEVLVYWPRKLAKIIVNARVGSYSDCFGNSDCIACDKDECTVCRNGYTQGKDCVKECNNGYYLAKGKDCEKCGENCAKCNDDTGCDLCKNGYVLQNTQCQQACDAGYTDKNGVCTKINAPPKGIHKNGDLSDIIAAGCVVKYHVGYEHITTNQIIENIRNGCKKDTLILMGATLKANDDDIHTYAVDNCQFATIQRPTKYGWGTINSQTPGLYWARMHNYCFAWSKYSRMHFNQCMAVNKGNIPEVQFHLLGSVGGYACEKVTGNHGNKYKKLIMTCDV